MHRLLAVVSVVGTVLLTGLPAIGDGHLTLEGVPRADCGPGSDPETAEQGRIPPADRASGRADRPYTCNTELVGHHGSTGGFKVFRYIDQKGTECAFYDSTILLPVNVLDQASTGFGVIVLDMTDPSNPVATTTLTTPAMLSPHESLVLHEGRGLLAAVLGTAATYPGLVDIYDVSEDCTQPQLLSSTPVGFLGHESGMAPDGMTLYVASTATGFSAAVDISDPTLPVPLWVGTRNSHGINISDDGSRGYFTPIDIENRGVIPSNGQFRGGVAIYDTSAIQERAANPEPVLISETTWPEASIPQIAIPVTIDGHPYLVELDEYVSFRNFTSPDAVPGAGRIIDISDETAPHVVSNIRLEVHDPAIRAAEDLANDFPFPEAAGALGYVGHYCAVPQREDPGIVACGMTASGMRVFDIRDPHNPREIAYFNAPVDNSTFLGQWGTPVNFSAPAFVPERSEIWYSDGASGFWVVRVTNDVWPFTDHGAVDPSDEDPDAASEPQTEPTPSTGLQVPVAFALVIALLALALWRRREGPPSAVRR
ncbi:MAG: hypothetical protein R3249_02050 [Nitriliruptorales bacterium]|nr:hypothetical protein [Nitriliruptorales bacterium]